MKHQSELFHPAEDRSLLKNLPAIMRQWRRILFVATFIGLIAAAALAFTLKDKYRSSALLIVKSQQLTVAVSGDSQGEDVDKRIARIRQVIMSSPILASLMTKHGLYGVKQSQSLSTGQATALAKAMRAAIVLEPAMTDLPASFGNQGTLALRLSYDYSNPVKAQAVAQDLLSNLVNMDASGNVQLANNTVEFLGDQAKTLEAQMSAVEGKITQISGANGRVLASQGVTMLGTGGGGNYDVQIAALQRDTAALVAQRDAARRVDSRDTGIAAAEAQLAAARAIYSENHPDVILAMQRLAQVRQLAQNVAANSQSGSIDSQIAFNNSQIMALRAAKGQEQAQVSSSLSAMSRAPMVQQQIAQLQQQLTGLNNQYQTISSRLLAARAGAKGGAEQTAESLSVVEYPSVPLRPVSPKRPFLIMLGAAAGLFLGLVLAILLELMLKPVRTPEDLAAITGVPPLGIVPILRPTSKSNWLASLSPAKFWNGLRSDVLGILGRIH